ncbi:MAG TPA: hypothetical protein VJK48_06345 [Chlamydiales bacterium]|nr:hypothetical protein [Chlamydiales bacterium]
MNSLFRDSAIELGVSSLITSLVLPYSTYPVASAMLTHLAMQTVANTTFRGMGEFVAFCEQSRETRLGRMMIIATHVLPPIDFQLVHGNLLNTLIHEFGHATANLLVYQNSVPNIQIDLLSQTGSVAANAATLSNFGSLLGKTGARIFVTAMGPLAVLSWGVMCIAMAKIGPPKLKPYLYLMGCCSFASTGLYAFSTPTYERAGHDFSILKTYVGLPPIPTSIFLFMIAAYPLILFLKEVESQAASPFQVSTPDLLLQ